ncbi:glycosyltransferase family 1 protein [Dubosiella muris]|uniref:Glycosyltransferase family 1 protein n=1 Tax=Dubosiella muris TaxID=3038133 RepID=A0AC61R805_9FIRM|nr:glycosyltransferase family 1 protein [Dubosiella muris]TGY66069.1 glycosyltransferase family 1 protein [Dubosiella muris]
MGNQVRVLHIIQRMEAGGTQALLMNIYRKIDRTKLQFDFLVVYKENQFYDNEIKEMGGKVYKLSFREDLNLLKFQKDLANFFEQHHEYQIVHCHAYTIGYFCLKAAMKAGIPTRIAHSHSNGVLHDIKYFPRLFMQRKFTKYATDLFACSEEAGKYLFKSQPFQILKNAIDSKQFIANADIRKEIRAELGISESFVLGHVGRLKPEKNHDFLLDVFSEIKKRKKEAELILIGTGPLEEKIRNKISEMNLGNCVHLLGNRKDMSRVYQAMDIFVFPSLYEGLGIVAIEAQAAGIPIICSDKIPSEVNITPLYKKMSLDDSIENWSKEIIKNSKNELRHKDTYQLIIKAGYEIEKVANNLEKFYLDSANNKEKEVVK